MKPYLILAGVLFVVMVAVLFWPSKDNPEAQPQAVSSPVAVETTQVEAEPEQGITDMVKPDVFVAPPTPSPVEIEPDMEINEFEAEEVPVVIPVDTSDATVKSELMNIASSQLLGRLLVNERLIEKFVINVHNLANADLSPKDSLVVPPEQTFNTFEQADRVYIDSASFQRYNMYVDVIESIDIDDLVGLFDMYETQITQRFGEISRPNQSFDDALLDAIDLLLDTPQVPVPIEVYSESVVYKFKDPRIEALAGPQKQLLRMGPQNMRRLKDVLREIKDAFESRG